MNVNLRILNQTKRSWLGVVIALFLIVFFFKHCHSNRTQQNNGVWVEARTAKRGNISLEMHAVGTLVAENQVTITSEMAGHIATIFVKNGSLVKKGTSLIQLDDTIPKAQLASARADFDFSQMTYQRREILGKKGLWPKQEIDQARADLEEKRAALQEKQATVDKMLLLAPFDGVLGKYQASPGDYVTPGQALVTLTDIQSLRAEFSVSEQYLSLLKLEQVVKITTTAYPDKKFEGKIAYISPTIDVTDRTISLYAEVPNPDHLLTAGMSISITQSLGVQNNTILIPAKSLMATLEGQQVYKIVDNKAFAVPVVIGQRGEDSVEIIQGLSDKDVVVVAGQQKLHDHMAVQIKE